MVKKHTMEWKKREAAELTGLFEENSVVAVADLTRFPANLFGDIRKKLAGKAVVRVTKTRVAMKALEGSKFKGCGIGKFLKGSIAILFTEMDPFELYLLLKKCKGKAPAKAGMIADNDIIVPAGDTGLPPGPDLAVLKAAGLPVQLKGASIKLSEDKVVARKGEKVSEAVAGALAKLDIKPVEVCLKVTAAVEGNQLYEADVLDIDIDETIGKLVKAYKNSLNLSVSIAFPNKANITILVAKSFREAKNVALEAEYLCSGTAPELLGKADRQARALGALAKPGKAPGEAKAKAGKEEARPEKEEKKETGEEKAKAPAGGMKGTVAKKEGEAGKKEEKPKEGKPMEEKPGEEKPGEGKPMEGKPGEAPKEPPKKGKKE